MINNEWVPWATYPGVTAERLAEVANTIWAARNEAADDYRPDKGETNWSLGVCAFERTCYAVSQASIASSWLTIKSGTGGGPVVFVFSIGGHPVRFFRGEPEDIPERYRMLPFPECDEQREAAKQYALLPPGRALRFVIENDSTGRPVVIYLVEMDGETGKSLSVYEIPREGRNVTPFARPSPPANIPPVTAELVTPEESETTKASSDDK